MPAPDRLCSVIGRLYECALDPALWSSAIEDVRRLFECHDATLSVNLLPSGATAFEVSTGVAPHWREGARGYGAEVLEAWGGYERILDAPLCEPIVLGQAADPACVAGNRYVREWATPQGITAAVLVAFSRSATMGASLAMGRHRSAGPVTDEMLGALRLLAPHFRRALAISQLLEKQALQARALLDTLDQLASGVVLVDAAAHVVHANGPAEALLASRRYLRTVEGALCLGQPALTRRLREAILAAGDNDAPARVKPLALPVGSEDGEAAMIHLLPLGRRGERAPCGAVAALFVTGTSEASASPALDALASLFDLTPAEGRVLDLVAQGLTPSEIAARTGVGLSTVKSHLGQVFAKTGRRRQADLVRLVHALRSPV